MSDNDRSGESPVSRRAVLAATGLTGVSALAGCSGDTPTQGTNTGVSGMLDNETSTDNASRDSEGAGNGLVDQSLTIPGRYVPTELRWNPYAPSNYAEQGGYMVFDPFLRNNRSTGELIPYLFQEWSIDGTTLTINLREGDTWHNGEPVTAEDIVTKFTIDSIFGYPVADYLNGVTAVDETTVEYEMADSYQEQVIMTILSQSWLNTPTSEYGQFVERYSDDLSEEELTTLQGDIQDHEIEEPVGSGPFQFESANQQVLTLSKYEDHPSADQINFPYYEVQYSASNQQQWAAMKNLTGLDATTTTIFPSRIRETLPDAVRQFLIPAYNGYSMAFNHNDEDFGRRNVRRAVANVIDQGAIGELSDITKTAVEVPAGVGSFHTDTWRQHLGDEADSFSSYTDTDRAAELLRQEGYSKEGGTWMKPNGDPFEFEIPVPGGWSDHVTLTNVVAQQLSDFGIEATNTNVENTTFFGQYWGPTDFKMCPWFWNNSGQTAPFFIQSWLLNSDTVTNLGFPEEPPVPPLGDRDGETSPFDTTGKLQELATVTDQSQREQLVKELGWAVNQSLPIYPIVEDQSQAFWDTSEWNVPEKQSDELYVQSHYYWLPRVGAVSARQQS